jgi:hypothetical protein
MTKADDMMILDVEKRRSAFRNMYALELGKLHATGVCRWPIERLPAILDTVMGDLVQDKVAPRGPAYEAVKKFLGLKSNKAVLEFLSD